MTLPDIKPCCIGRYQERRTRHTRTSSSEGTVDKRYTITRLREGLRKTFAGRTLLRPFNEQRQAPTNPEKVLDLFKLISL